MIQEIEENSVKLLDLLSTKKAVFLRIELLKKGSYESWP